MRIAFIVVALLAATHSVASAWGLRGHEIAGRAAVAHWPAALPAWLQTDDVKEQIVYLGAEEDRLKIGGSDARAWSREWNTDHYVDVADDGTIGGVLTLAALPPTRDEYIAALAAAHVDAYNVGFLPYAIIEGFEQVRSDFALERFAEAKAAAAAPLPDHQRALGELTWRRALTVHDIGLFSHFVEDASQPLHTSVHFNGWGSYPNPAAFTTAKTTHAMFESAFVQAFANEADVAHRVGEAQTYEMVPMHALESYIASSVAQTTPFYRLEKRGGFALDGPATAARAEAIAFTDARLAAAAQMLDSLVLTAYQTSLTIKPYSAD